MYQFIIAPLFLSYCTISFFIIKFVNKKMIKNKYKTLTIIILILLPTWDVALSFILLPLTTAWWPRQDIYTVIQTDHLLFGGNQCGFLEKYISSRNTEESKPLCAASGVYRNSLRYSEEKINKIIDGRKTITLDKLKFIKCTPARISVKKLSEKMPITCFETDNIESHYSMNHYIYNFLLLDFEEFSIGDMSTNTTTAIARFIKVREYSNFFFIPFFQWFALKNPWHSGIKHIYTFPNTPISDFEQKALGPLS